MKKNLFLQLLDLEYQQQVMMTEQLMMFYYVWQLIVYDVNVLLFFLIENLVVLYVHFLLELHLRLKINI
jgi:hypothetical protein